LFCKIVQLNLGTRFIFRLLDCSKHKVWRCEHRCRGDGTASPGKTRDRPVRSETYGRGLLLLPMRYEKLWHAHICRHTWQTSSPPPSFPHPRKRGASSLKRGSRNSFFPSQNRTSVLYLPPKPDLRRGTLTIEIASQKRLAMTRIHKRSRFTKEARDDENTQERSLYPASRGQVAFARDDLIPLFTVKLPFCTIKKQCK